MLLQIDRETIIDQFGSADETASKLLTKKDIAKPDGTHTSRLVLRVQNDGANSSSPERIWIILSYEYSSLVW